MLNLSSYFQKSNIEIVFGYKAVDKNYRSKFIGPDGKYTFYLPNTIPSCLDFKANGSCGNGLHFSYSVFEARQYIAWNSSNRYLCCPLFKHEINVIDIMKVKAPRCAFPIWEVDRNGKPIIRDSAGRINRKMKFQTVTQILIEKCMDEYIPF